MNSQRWRPVTPLPLQIRPAGKSTSLSHTWIYTFSIYRSVSELIRLEFVPSGSALRRQVYEYAANIVLFEGLLQYTSLMIGP